MSCLRENLLAESASVILPPELEQVVADLPKYVDRRVGADLITKHMFPVSFRTLRSLAAAHQTRQRPRHRADRKAVRDCVRQIERGSGRYGWAPERGRRNAQPDHYLGAVNAEVAVKVIGMREITPE